jgi:hypothetical protein
MVNPSSGSFLFVSSPTTIECHLSVQGPQEPPDKGKVERQQTERTGQRVCVCQQAAFSLLPTLLTRNIMRLANGHLFEYPGKEQSLSLPVVE